MKFAYRLKLDDEREKLWYEIIRLENEIRINPSSSLRSTLNTHRSRYAYICKIMKLDLNSW